MQPGQRFAALEKLQIGPHRGGGDVAIFGIVPARAGDDGVKFHQPFAIGKLA